MELNYKYEVINNMTIRSIIKDKYNDLRLGETINDICPVCNGGDHKDKSFSITRKANGFIYICFRNKCGIRGFIMDVHEFENELPKGFKPKNFTRPLLPINKEIRDTIAIIYGISSEEIVKQRWKLDITDEGDYRLYIPLFDIDGFPYGALSVKKSFLPGKSERPKVIIYRWENRPLVHYPKTELIDGPVVLVEDAISATRLAPLVRSAALLGTHMSAGQARSLRAASPSIVIALDLDTWYHKVPKPLVIKDEYQFLFDEISLLKLEKDVKDMSKAEFGKFVDSILEVGNET